MPLTGREKPFVPLVKLLFDENLSPRLARAVADDFPNSAHVHEMNLGATDDSEIWRYALDNHFTIVSKDSDFLDISIVSGHPPKVIQLNVGNVSTSTTEKLLKQNLSHLKRFMESDQPYFVIS